MAQQLELLWWRRYLSKRTKVDYLNWKKKYWIDFLDQITSISFHSKMNVLDIACGPAGLFTINRFEKLTALDPLLNHYEEKIACFSKRDYPGVTFLSSPLKEVEFKKEGFDVVFALNAFNHFSDLKSNIMTAKGLVNSQGYLVVSSDFHRYRFFKYVFRFFPGDLLHPQQDEITDYVTIIQDQFNLIQQLEIKKSFLFSYSILIFKRF